VSYAAMPSDLVMIVQAVRSGDVEFDHRLSMDGAVIPAVLRREAETARATKDQTILLKPLDNFLHTREAVGSGSEGVGDCGDRDRPWRGANNLVRAGASGGPLLLADHRSVHSSGSRTKPAGPS
jgi:hypothetical protein